MNIPNLLTIIRFLLIPVFVYCFFSDGDYATYMSAIIFLLAGLTDVFDGYIARKYNLITRLGIVLDPLADKLMLLTVLISITIRYKLPVWVIGIVGLKEILMIIGAVALYNGHDVVVPANKFGKISTITAYVAVLAVIFDFPYRNLIVSLFVIMAVIAFIVYINNFISIKKKNNINVLENRVDKQTQ